MTQAQYTYTVKEQSGRNVISIIDLNQGTMSVTNDIENVVKEVARNEGIDPNQYMIIYCDSDGDWDGWNNTDEKFIILNAFSEEVAIQNYINLQLNFPMKHLVIGPEEVKPNPAVNTILKRMWELNNKRVTGSLSEEEKVFFNTNLHVIKDYYENNSYYWLQQEKV